MFTEKQIGRVITSLLLAIVFVFPMVIQFSHAFEGHDHIPCKEISTHIHQDATDCNICDFHLASIDYNFVKHPEFLAPNIPSEVKKSFTPVLSNSFKQTSTQLRAPPIFLFS
jgi:hypothetical protein